MLFPLKQPNQVIVEPMGVDDTMTPQSSIKRGSRLPQGEVEDS
jgi:hypothetical protein